MATKTRKPATNKATGIGMTATPKKTSKKAAVKKGPGVIDSILEFLQGANSKAPLTKDELVQKLAARFKDREAKALRTTMNCQLGKRIEEARKVKLHQNDDGGYWITK